ncbi:fungal specific transcription factor, putative [Cordyceps militaris CM01]|uniref:Fungal specific transcription factor, putative n=1 Tax=Cordyceps militaris (strain CM01) TaxID=983644 RepID=G3JEX6_CORMM|nr:fungal specific transcription factor, putative [Cordyceps militaris CM01]EGX93469.1 fungal specific transcription factor, putative [Cordyceps militaris CM01]
MSARISNARLSSRYSCLQCREAKRKCDRVTPECTLCAHPSQASTQSRDALEPGAAQIQQLRLVTEHFLDPDVFRHAQLQLPALQIDSLLTDDITATVGGIADIRTIAQKHFATVHVWMPIVSKVLFYKLLLKRLTYNRAELHLLLLAMKLSGDVVTKTPQTQLYEVTKQFQHSAQNSGIFSLLVLQAGIFIACYELGHGIYPAAFMSISSCARYAAALGVDSSVSGHVEAKIETLDLEECRRAWWTILAMDRFMSLANPKRRLVTPDPDTSNYLPIDDQNWDNGTAGPEDACTLGSANTLEMGRFARLAQAAHLLSLVIQDVAVGADDSTQLRRTIFALVHVSRLEARARRLELCSQMSTCFSAILLLDHPTSFHDATSEQHSSHPDATLSPESASVLKSTIEMAERILGAHEAVKNIIAPFVLHVNYKAASVYLQRAVEEPSGVEAGYVATLKKSLKLFSQRWLVADEVHTAGPCEIRVLNSPFEPAQSPPYVEASHRLAETPTPNELRRLLKYINRDRLDVWTRLPLTTPGAIQSARGVDLPGTTTKDVPLSSQYMSSSHSSI